MQRSAEKLNLDPGHLFLQVRTALESAMSNCNTSMREKMIEEAWSSHRQYLFLPCLITSERIALSLCLLDLYETLPQVMQDKNSSLITNIRNYLVHLFNVKEITPVFRQDIKDKLRVDPYYLPNCLPFYLSPPKKEETRKAFLKRRMKEHFLAAGKKYILRMDPSQVHNEAHPKQAMLFFRSGKAREWELRDAKKALSKYEKAIYSNFASHWGAIVRHNEYEEYEKLEYLNVRTRDAYRVFISEGGFKQATLDPSQKENPFQVKPACTAGYRSHDKDRFACMVINSRGEIYIANHIELIFNHGSFMSGGDVMFAGEIRINAQGKITGLTNYSGHYLSALTQQYNLYLHLKKLGVDFSSCQFFTINQLRRTKMKPTNPTAMTNAAMDVRSEKDFVSFCRSDFDREQPDNAIPKQIRTIGLRPS